jgi:hypothetical protein
MYQRDFGRGNFVAVLIFVFPSGCKENGGRLAPPAM